ncbi:MAG: hypothetical protein K2J76_03975, partial [Oscillospiraceae bacterium]|nr:hypothetical protein [Oscillospiraceae bacterium]
YSLKTQFFSDCGVSLINETQRGINTSTLLERGFFDRLAEAYEKDIMNITEENYYKSELKNEYRLTLNTHLYNITIPESFSNTLAVVEQFGFTVEKKEELPDMEVSGHLKNASKGGNFLIFTADEWREMNTVPDSIPLHASYNLSRGMDNRIYVENIDKDVCDLFRAAEPMNIVPDNGYIIYVFGRTWVIPDELNGIAERVYAGISTKGSIEYDENGNPFWLESTDEILIPQEVPDGTTAYYVYD